MSDQVELRGDCLTLSTATEHEVVLAGPRDTGKTIAASWVAHCYCSLAPGCQGSIIRKVQASMSGTVLMTFEKVVKGTGVRKIGGHNPTKYVYPNGSTIWVGGMDNPGKSLSGERDFIYVNQAEELTEAEWETLAGCCSGRGAVVSNPQLFGDCNPGPAKHWIKRRAEEGKLRLLSAKHIDNPTLYDRDGRPLPGCEARLAVLSNQTGVRRKRYFEGIWATAEGAVYEMFDSTSPLYVCIRNPEEMKRWFLAIDEGFVNPWVILVIGADSDNRWHIFKELHKPGILQTDIVRQAKEWFDKYHCEIASVDAAAAGLIAELQSAGINAKPGKGDVNGGIHCIQDRLKVQGDGRTRLTVDPSCRETINEFESYIYKPASKDGKLKDEPLKENDHSMDALRYLAHVLGELKGSFTATTPPAILGGKDPRIPEPRIFTPRYFRPRQLL